MDLFKAWPCSEGSAIDKYPHQIQLLIPNRPRSRARRLGTFHLPISAGECPATAAAGKWPCLPPPNHRPQSGGRRRLADAGHGPAVAR